MGFHSTPPEFRGDAYTQPFSFSFFFSGSCETVIFFSAGTTNLSLFCSKASPLSLSYYCWCCCSCGVFFGFLFFFKLFFNFSWLNEFNLIRSVDFVPIYASYLLELFQNGSFLMFSVMIRSCLGFLGGFLGMFRFVLRLGL